MTLNALVAADRVLIPMQCEYYALEGLSYLCSTIDNVRGLWNPRLAIEGILLTMVDGRNNLTQQVEGEVRGHFGQQVYATMIPRNVRLSESPSHGMPILLYDAASRGALSYSNLARELLDRHAAEAAAAPKAATNPTGAPATGAKAGASVSTQGGGR